MIVLHKCGNCGQKQIVNITEKHVGRDVSEQNTFMGKTTETIDYIEKVYEPAECTRCGKRLSF